MLHSLACLGSRARTQPIVYSPSHLCHLFIPLCRVGPCPFQVLSSCCVMLALPQSRALRSLVQRRFMPNLSSRQVEEMAERTPWFRIKDLGQGPKMKRDRSSSRATRSMASVPPIVLAWTEGLEFGDDSAVRHAAGYRPSRCQGLWQL